MKKSDFYFDLPEDLIAQYPLTNRSDSKLLHYDRQTKQYHHRYFKELADLFNPGDLLVLNNSKVIPARFYGWKETGGRVEFLIERILGEDTFLAHIKASKAPKNGSLIHLDNQEDAIEIIAKHDDLYQCRSFILLESLLENVGHIPLPLYITRPDEVLDNERYQTVYALHKGSVAAPTAGLHFDDLLLARLKQKGIDIAYLTLHVGAGTFRPLRCDSIFDHKMHTEQFVISEELCAKIKEVRERGNRIIAVGTTTLRSLESLALEEPLAPGKKETDIFIYPGFEFKFCDGLVTNFHLPESSLLILVSAFIGQKEALNLYEEAIKERYRFYSYGDASLLL